MRILHLICSPRGQASESYRLSQTIVGHLLNSEPAATVVTRPIGGALVDLDQNYATALGATEWSFAELFPKAPCPGPKN
jgi:FMN-dependent NADH-azoreductase